MTDEVPQFVAVAPTGYGDGDETYVLPGRTTLEEAFKIINDRRILHKVSRISLHLNSTADEPYLNRFSRSSLGADEGETKPTT